MKRIFAALTAACLMLSVFSGCHQSAVSSEVQSQSAGTGSVAEQGGTVSDDNWKIAILTSTVTQGEEPYRAAELVAEKYPGRIVHVTFPDNFTTEQEVALSTILSVGADPDVKALLIAGTPAGFAALIDKLKEQRPDILVWAGSPSDDATVISEAADVVFNTDIPAQG